MSETPKHFEGLSLGEIQQDTGERLQELARRIDAGSGDKETIRAGVKSGVDMANANFPAVEGMIRDGLTAGEIPGIAALTNGIEQGLTGEAQKIYRTEMVGRMNTLVTKLMADGTVKPDLASQLFENAMEALRYHGADAKKACFDAMRSIQQEPLAASFSKDFLNKHKREALAAKMEGANSGIGIEGGVLQGLDGNNQKITGFSVLTGAAMTDVNPNILDEFILKNVIPMGDGTYLAQMENGCRGNLVVMKTEKVIDGLMDVNDPNAPFETGGYEPADEVPVKTPLPTPKPETPIEREVAEAIGETETYSGLSHEELSSLEAEKEVGRAIGTETKFSGRSLEENVDLDIEKSKGTLLKIAKSALSKITQTETYNSATIPDLQRQVETVLAAVNDYNELAGVMPIDTAALEALTGSTLPEGTNLINFVDAVGLVQNNLKLAIDNSPVPIPKPIVQTDSVENGSTTTAAPAPAPVTTTPRVLPANAAIETTTETLSETHKKAIAETFFHYFNSTGDANLPALENALNKAGFDTNGEFGLRGAVKQAINAILGIDLAIDGSHSDEYKNAMRELTDRVKWKSKSSISGDGHEVFETIAVYTGDTPTAARHRAWTTAPIVVERDRAFGVIGMAPSVGIEGTTGAPVMAKAFSPEAAASELLDRAKAANDNALKDYRSPDSTRENITALTAVKAELEAQLADGNPNNLSSQTITYLKGALRGVQRSLNKRNAEPLVKPFLDKDLSYNHVQQRFEIGDDYLPFDAVYNEDQNRADVARVAIETFVNIVTNGNELASINENSGVQFNFNEDNFSLPNGRTVPIAKVMPEGEITSSARAILTAFINQTGEFAVSTEAETLAPVTPPTPERNQSETRA